MARTTLTALDRSNPPPAVIAGRVNRLSAIAVRLLGRRRSTVLVGSMMARATA